MAWVKGEHPTISFMASTYSSFLQEKFPLTSHKVSVDYDAMLRAYRVSVSKAGTEGVLIVQTVPSADVEYFLGAPSIKPSDDVIATLMMLGAE